MVAPDSHGTDKTSFVEEHTSEEILAVCKKSHKQGGIKSEGDLRIRLSQFNFV